MKYATISILLMLVATTGFRLWCISYRCSNAQLATQVEFETIKRITMREAAPPDTNSWSEVSRLLQLPAMPHTGGPVDLPPELDRADLSKWMRPLEPPSKIYQETSFQQALLNYQHLLKSLGPAMAKRGCFKPSNWKLGLQESPGPSIGLGYAFRNAEIYAGYLSAQGDVPQALTVLFQHLEFAEKIGETDGGYSSGLSDCLYGLESILPHLSSSQLDDCQKRLARLSSPTEHYLRRRDESYLEQLQTLRLAETGQHQLIRLPASQRFLGGLGFFQREEVAIRNLYLTQRARMQRGLLAEDFSQSPHEEVKAEQLQAHTYLLEDICKNDSYSYHQASCLRAEAALEAARISCAIRRFQKRHSFLPSSLEELCPEFRLSLPHNPVTTDGRFSYQKADNNGYILESKYRPALKQALLPDDAEGTCYCRPLTQK